MAADEVSLRAYAPVLSSGTVCHFLFFEIFCLTFNLKLFVNSQGQQPVEFNHAINYVNKIKVNTNPLAYSILTLSLFTCFERNNLSY